MARTLLSVISGCLALLLAGGGIVFLGWLLWWLWSRQQPEEKAEPVEIELETAGIERGTTTPMWDEETPTAVSWVPAPEPEPLLAEPEEQAAALSRAEERELFSEPEGAVEVPGAERFAGVDEPQPPQPISVADIEGPGGGDDLLIIEGIGPRCANVLRAAGIRTFRQLADADVAQLEGILGAADPRLLRLCKPSSWPEQAALVAAGDWEAFEALTNALKGGRRV